MRSITSGLPLQGKRGRLPNVQPWDHEPAGGGGTYQESTDQFKGGLLRWAGFDQP
jgi:hypothetical protein